MIARLYIDGREPHRWRSYERCVLRYLGGINYEVTFYVGEGGLSDKNEIMVQICQDDDLIGEVPLDVPRGWSRVKGDAFSITLPVHIPPASRVYRHRLPPEKPRDPPPANPEVKLEG